MSQPSESGEPNDTLTQFLTLLLAAVFASRFLVPTELPWRGGTIALSACTLLISAAWRLVQFCRRDESRRLDWLDAGAALILVGQLAATVWLFVFAAGDRHAAMIVLVEWSAVLSAAALIRDATRSASQRGDAVSSCVGLIVGLSVLGIWQHHYQYDSLIAEYRPMQARFETMVTTGVPDPGLLAEFARREIPTDPGALKLWEQRLLNSREPLGMFALANTIAGVLLVGLLLVGCAGVSRLGSFHTPGSGVSSGLQKRNRLASIGSWAPLILCSASVGWCLLLTKSRTGFAGTLAGCGAVVITVLLATRHRGRVLAAVVAGAVLGGAVVAAAFATGGLDRFVLSEAGKSLRYRLEYWSATSHTLGESPSTLLLGVGPGNFRQRYLKHKLPESSEEIADPHNLVLDVWTSGGVLSTAGLLLVMGCGVAAAFRRRSGMSLPHASGDEPANESSHVASPRSHGRSSAAGNAQQQEPIRIDPWLAGMALACLSLAILTDDYERLGVIGVTAAAATLALRRGLDWSALPAGAYPAAFSGLTVHLMGAGGIAMPAISLLWLSLAIWSHDSAASTAAAATRADWLTLRLSLPPAVWVFGCVVAFLPALSVLRGMPANDEGDYLWRERGDADRAMKQFEQAAVLAPWWTEPRTKLAELHRQIALAFPINAIEHWTDMEKWQSEVIALDPANPAAYEQAALRLADAAASAANSGQAKEYRRKAFELISRSVQLYPNGIRARKAAAFAAASVGETDAAAKHAAVALELHQLAEKLGHTDKLLPTDIQSRLRTIAARGRSKD